MGMTYSYIANGRMTWFHVALSVCTGLVLLIPGADVQGQSSTRTESASSDSAEVKIRLQDRDDRVHVLGVFENENMVADTLTYELQVRRMGATGTSVSRQSGSFVSYTGDVDSLSTTTISVRSGDQLKVRLQVFNEETLVGERVRARWFF